MKRKKIAVMLGVMFTLACLTIGCSGNTGSSTKESTKTTEAGSSTTTEAVPEPVDDDSVIEEDTAEVVPEADSTDTEAAQNETVDNPVAENAEGSTNSFMDDAGNWINVTMNASGQWVDESGMVYTFGDSGVTDENGNFYPY